MKILLINPPIREWSRPNVFPLGLGYIGAVLCDAGHDVKVMDINAHRFSRDEVEAKVKDSDYDAVGIGGIVTTYRYIKWLVQVLRKYHPDKKIIIGGSVASSVPDIVLEKNVVDILCIGEGEETVRELIGALESGYDLSKISGIWYRDCQGKVCRNENRDTVKSLGKIPLPAWDLFPMEIYLKNPVGAPNRNKWIDGAVNEDAPLSMNLYTSRGCPYNCIYCYHDFMGQGYRQRLPEEVVREMGIINERYNVSYFHFIDDEFVVKKDFVYKFCKLIKELSEKIGYKITWGCTGRVNIMTEDLIAAMADAGCVSIGYGIESGSQKMLDFIKKNVTVAQAKEAIRLTKKYLGWADCSLMIGYPGETMETIKETVDFCKELELVPEVIFFLTPYPGTELYSMALREGGIKDEEEYILGLGEQGERISVNFTDFSDGELYRIQEGMIKELKAWNEVKHR